MSKRPIVVSVLGLALLGRPAPSLGQAPTPPAASPAPAQAAAPPQAGAPKIVAMPPARVTFREAIDRAIQRNPSVEQAAQEILRANALLREATANILPSVNGNVIGTRLNTGVSFGAATATPVNQLQATATLSGLLFAPVQWALRVEAADNKRVAEAAAVETRRQVAFATAQAFLATIARARVLDADTRARDVAREHFALAQQLRERGAGSRLNELRAQQQLSSDEVLVEQAAIDLYRAQEALGVFVAEDAPVTAADEPVLEVPPELFAPPPATIDQRPDVRLAQAREAAAARVVSESWKDWLPSVQGLFQPQYAAPSTLFTPSWLWRAQFVASVPIFDAGLRGARRAEREVGLQEARIEAVGLLRQARSEIRDAEAAVRSAERALANARAAAQQAAQVVDIVNVSFRAGASTNIEVIDAQRAARDADTAAAVAEDQLRQARLALLVAAG